LLEKLCRRLDQESDSKRGDKRESVRSGGKNKHEKKRVEQEKQPETF